MKLKVFAIKDRALNAYMQPFFMHTTGQAIRAFTDNINDEKSQAYPHPDDYDLWELGDFEDSTGLFQINAEWTGPVQICMGKQVKVRQTT